MPDTCAPSSTPSDLLRGLRVFEGAQRPALAQAGRQLAAWGADVIRVDPIASRQPVHAGSQAGKRSIAIDLRRPRGRALLAQLVATPGPLGGVWCTDWPAADGPSYDELRAQRHDVLMVTLAQDAAPGSAAGSLLCSALLAGLFHRDRCGSGRQVTLGAADLGLPVPAAAAVTDRDGLLGDGFVTRDGACIAAGGLADPHWRSLLQATGLAAPAWALAARLDLNLADEGHRLQAREALAALVAPWFAARTQAEVAAVFDRHQLPWQPAAADRQPGPAAGAHTDAVLAEVLGLGPGEIGRLHDAGIVAGPAPRR